MKKLIFLLVFVCIEKAIQAQTPRLPYIYTIKADSVLITNSCDTAELILENHTQNVPGFLYNKGRGRTEFRRASQLNDSTLIFGGDTFSLKGGKNFANADLTFNGSHTHNGNMRSVNLTNFGAITLNQKTYDNRISNQLLMDSLWSILMTSVQRTSRDSTISKFRLSPVGCLFTSNDSYSDNTTWGMGPLGFQHTTSAYNGAQWADFEAAMSDNYGTLDVQLAQTGGEMDIWNVGRGLYLSSSNSSHNGSTGISEMGDSLIMTQSGAYVLGADPTNTKYKQSPTGFVFTKYKGTNDFRIIGLPASSSASDSMLVIDNNGQVKKSSQSTTRKSTTITGSTYTVTADVAVVFVNYASGQATITLPTGTLDREITIKNLSTANTVILSGIDSNESNSIATSGAITVKYTGSSWVGISKY